jgi:hypothetical protein
MSPALCKFLLILSLGGYLPCRPEIVKPGKAWRTEDGMHHIADIVYDGRWARDRDLFSPCYSLDREFRIC